ncbi:E3 ubiquitin-protein ligase TRIM39-like protein [Lates japonicus]|uniref:E3 ubiquitin-protein ligase TRIM39-like protein n=1 Tax=Lates japonicus TaxID=270547 RepID=A0AAD3NM34_LATJO|nr:E3 ubiquitin-protein ligase TRIM39-like protein [Lates japonicus]
MAWAADNLPSCYQYHGLRGSKGQALELVTRFRALAIIRPHGLLVLSTSRRIERSVCGRGHDWLRARPAAYHPEAPGSHKGTTTEGEWSRVNITNTHSLILLPHHKTHEFVPLKEYEGEKAELRKTEAKTQQMIQKRRLKIQEIKHSVE